MIGIQRKCVSSFYRVGLRLCQAGHHVVQATEGERTGICSYRKQDTTVHRVVSDLLYVRSHCWFKDVLLKLIVESELDWLEGSLVLELGQLVVILQFILHCLLGASDTCRVACVGIGCVDYVAGCLVVVTLKVVSVG